VNACVFRLVGAGPATAARQAAALFALAAVLAIAGVALTPGRAAALLAVAVADLLTAAAAWWLPFARWGRLAPLALALPAFAVLAGSTWAFGGVVVGTGPFFVLVYAWIGLNFPPWASVAVTPAAAAAYLAPLVLTGQPPEVVGSAVILLPIAVGIGLLIANQVEHHRADRERIAQIERWRAALTTTLAHDLRSPLTAVQLALESLRSDGDEMSAAQRDHMLATALRQVGRVNRLCTALLDVERVDAHGELRLDRVKVSLRRAVGEAVDQLNARDVEIHVDGDPVIEADAERLQQILVNLIGNALRHGLPPVVITVERDDGGAEAPNSRSADAARRTSVAHRDSAPPDAWVHICVRDHGPGVPPGERDRLFGRFTAGDPAGRSAGLGLWIVDQLARAHGGRVRYEPAEPGARIVVTLPVVGAAAEAPVGTGRAAASVRTGAPYPYP
jgi:signal transduction histidine kinase